MNFQVKVGREFDDDEDFTVTIIHARSEPVSARKLILVAFFALVFGSVTASAAYGAMTGDYAPLKAIAEAGSALISKATNGFINGK